MLIGRTSHLAALVQFIEQSCGGRGQTILIAGEAGIGKSRLVAEALAHLRSPHARAVQPTALILQGRCFEPDHAFPYAPLIDMLRSILVSHSPHDIIASSGFPAPELVTLLPEFATALPDLLQGTALDSEQEKRRLFHALLDFFVQRSKREPLVIVVEDVHWSDDTSLEFLLYLAQRITSQRILLLLTYRSEEVRPELTRFLAGLDRERLATEFALTPLSIDEVGEMIRTILALPHPVRADFLETIYGLTEGNPFFIEEVLTSLSVTGEFYYTDEKWSHKPLHELRIPRSVQVTVQRRLEHVSLEARELLSLAAVAGRRFDFALLQQLTGRNEAELVYLIKKLMTAQLVVEESEEVFAFRHALTRQAVYTDLLARERKALHRTIAQTMERLYASTLDAHVADLAYHFGAAGAWSKVLEYAPRAGAKALSLHAPRAAIEQFSHALEAAHRLSLEPSPRLYRARAQAYEVLGAFEAACDDHMHALQAARNAHDSMEEWQSLLDLGALWTARDYTRAGDYLHHALELARDVDDASILAHSLNRLGNWYINREQPGDARRYHEEALTIFQTRSDRHGLAETLDFLGVASWMGGDLIAGMGYYEQAIALWRALEERRGLVSSLATFAMRSASYFCTTTVWPPASGADCVRDGEEAIKLARQMGWRSAEGSALLFLGLGLGPRGEYAQALKCARAGLEIASEIEHGPWMTTAYLLLGMLSLDLLALPEARQHLEQALTLAKEMGSLFLVRTAIAFLASAYIAQQDFAAADAVLNTAFGTDTSTQTQAQRLVWCARAELELARGHPGVALPVINRLIASAAHIAQGAVIPRLWHLRAVALMALDRAAEAEAVLHAARATAQAQEARPLLWRICATLGKLYQAQAHREQAQEACTTARTLIEELAATLPDEATRETFLHSAIRQLPRLPQPSPRRVARQAFGGLTEREREVAALIAQGKSNRELAHELVVSERTIKTHVENILSKLGFASRAQIAVWAVEKGLVKHTI